MGESCGLRCGDHRHVMVAVDGPGEHSERVVRYVGALLGGVGGFRVTLLHVICEPGAEFFASEGERAMWLDIHDRQAREALEAMKEILVRGGFDPGMVGSMIKVIPAMEPLQRVIFAEAEALGACTIALSRRGISKKEELLFGSTTNALMHEASNCALWIIESPG